MQALDGKIPTTNPSSIPLERYEVPEEVAPVYDVAEDVQIAGGTQKRKRDKEGGKDKDRKSKSSKKQRR